MSYVFFSSVHANLLNVIKNNRINNANNNMYVSMSSAIIKRYNAIYLTTWPYYTLYLYVV